MSTRSLIGILNEDDTVDWVYCHWDGYIDHVGRMLRDHYKSEPKIRELLLNGDLSSLEEEISMIKFYDKEKSFSKSGSVNRYLNENHFQSFLYLFIPKKNEWLIADTHKKIFLPFNVFEIKQELEEDEED